MPARFARLVKIEHTVFALPFAYVGALLAVGRTPSAHDLLWITLAMVGARSLAMALNRLIDAGIDARNPRTAGREIPSGQLSMPQVVLFCAGSLALFLVAVWQLDPLLRPEDRSEPGQDAGRRRYRADDLVLNACKPYDWLDEFPPVASTLRLMLSRVTLKKDRLSCSSNRSRRVCPARDWSSGVTSNDRLFGPFWKSG